MANIIADVNRSVQFGGVRANVLSAYLTQFDTVFFVDDSGTMNAENWRTVERALLSLAAEVSKFDGDGVSVRFFNDPTVLENTKSPGDILNAFSRVNPRGLSNVGKKLKHILDDYVAKLLRALQSGTKAFFDVKPLNIIVLTAGDFTEEPEEIIEYLRPIISQLKVLKNPEDLQRRVGIQLVQVGDNGEARLRLQSLDDAFRKEEDIIDTTQWNEKLGPETLVKILLGAIHDKIDDDPTYQKPTFNPQYPNVNAPSYPHALALNEQAFWVPYGQTCEVTAQSNAALWQRVTVSVSPPAPGFPRVFDGYGESNTMRSNGDSFVIVGGNSWVLVSTEYSREFGSYRSYRPTPAKVLSNEMRAGKTSYLVGADDYGVSGNDPDGDYNDVVVRLAIGA